MNCLEIQSLAGPYLDSELDAQTSLAVQQHLAACPACARQFAEEQKFQATLRTALQHGEATPQLWEQTEALVRHAAARPVAGRREQVAGTEPWWRVWLWPNPQFYAGVVALWILMFAVHFGSVQEPPPPPSARRPHSPAVQSALAEQRREFGELLGTATPLRAAADPRSQRISPRSDLRPGRGQTGQVTWPLAVFDAMPV